MRSRFEEDIEVMTRAKSLLMVAAFSVFGLANAIAEETRAGRYTMHKADDGFVRLDTQTGAVSLCRKSVQGWGCEPMLDSETGATGELARLRDENAELKSEIKRMDELLELRGDRRKSAGNLRDFKLPSEQEVDQALNYFERMLKKFQDRLKRLERKSEPPERQL